MQVILLWLPKCAELKRFLQEISVPDDAINTILSVLGVANFKKEMEQIWEESERVRLVTEEREQKEKDEREKERVRLENENRATKDRLENERLEKERLENERIRLENERKEIEERERREKEERERREKEERERREKEERERREKEERERNVAAIINLPGPISPQPGPLVSLQEPIKTRITKLLHNQDKLLGMIDEAEREYDQMVKRKRAPLPSEDEKRAAHTKLQHVISECERNRSTLIRMAQFFDVLLLENDLIGYVQHEKLLQGFEEIESFTPYRMQSHYDDIVPLKVTSRHPVYTASWEGRNVVLKRYALREDDLKKLKREIRLLKFLESENIARVNAMFVDGPDTFVEMPFYGGGTIDRWIESKRDSLVADGGFANELIRVFGELIEALNHLHSNHVVHCDVKPDNIFVRDDGKIVLGDFDISKSSDERRTTAVRDLRTMTAHPKTAAYAAPELLDERARASASSDIYSAALVMCELIEPGIVEKKQIDIARLRSNPALAGLDSLFVVLERMLANDPASRPTALDVLRATAGTSNSYPLPSLANRSVTSTESNSTDPSAPNALIQIESSKLKPKGEYPTSEQELDRIDDREYFKKHVEALREIEKSAIEKKNIVGVELVPDSEYCVPFCTREFNEFMRNSGNLRFALCVE